MFGVRYSTSQCTIWALSISVEKIEKSSIQPKWSFDVSVEVIWNSHTLSHGTATVGPIKEWGHQRITVLGERRVVKIYEFCLFFPLMIGSSNPDSPENCNRGEVSYLPVSEITLLHLKNGWDACCAGPVCRTAMQISCGLGCKLPQLRILLQHRFWFFEMTHCSGLLMVPENVKTEEISI